MSDSQRRIPVILMFDGTAAAHSIFNPNDWNGESRPIVASCASQYALLLFATAALERTYEGANQVCQARIADLKQQWQTRRWNLHRCRYFVEIPGVHLSIQAFLYTVKTLLDFLAQLISTEGVVGVKLHGFHKKGQIVGGEVLNSLVRKRKRVAVAERLHSYIAEQKASWIDEVVNARDDLAHPVRGMPQVMWELELTNREDEIQCERIVPPHIGSQPFEQYANATTVKMASFATTILHALHAAIGGTES